MAHRSGLTIASTRTAHYAARCGQPVMRYVSRIPQIAPFNQCFIQRMEDTRMFRQRTSLYSASIFVLQAIISAFLLSVSDSEAREYGPPQHNRSIRSPDGQYIAKAGSYSGQASNVHYRVVSSDGSNRVRFDTQAQYKTPNDVKAGAFSSDSRYFAAAYHYGHKGNYTWMGVWELPSARLVHSETASGFLYDVSGVFSKLPPPPPSTGGINGTFFFDGSLGTQQFTITAYFKGEFVSGSGTSGKKSFLVKKTKTMYPTKSATVSFSESGLARGKWRFSAWSNMTGAVGPCKATVPGFVKLSVINGPSCN